MKIKNVPVQWQDFPDPEFPFVALVDGKEWKLRLNDFPDEPMFTLFVDGEDQGSFDDTPPYWTLPA